MALISDGLLLAAAVAAIFYCFFVSRRLGGLKKQAADLTAKLGELDKTVSQVRVAIAEGRELAEAEKGRLTEMRTQSDRLRRELQSARGTLEKSLSRQTTDVEKPAEEDPISRIKRLQRRQKVRSAS